MAEDIFKKLSGLMEYDKDLSQVVAYEIGGKAKYFYTPKNSTDLLLVLNICQNNSIPLFILGSGTNVLVSDSGFDGLVLWLGPTANDKESEVEVLSDDLGEVCVRVPAHYAKAKLLDVAIKNNWLSLEFSAGIPGSLGGAVFKAETDPEKISDTLIARANDAGGGDNITVIVAKLEPKSHWSSLTDRVKGALSKAKESK
jgi:UDP-N-acetylenolpyruvoylglucosamine reductase